MDRRDGVKGAKGQFAGFAVPGTEVLVRVTPGARRSAVLQQPDGLAVHVTEPPADGKANAAVQAALARALGVAKSRLTLVRGATSRTKTFRLD